MASNSTARGNKSKKSFKHALAKSVSNLFGDSSRIKRNTIEDKQVSKITDDNNSNYNNLEDDNFTKISSSTPSFSPRIESDVESELKSIISDSDKSSLPSIVLPENSDYQIDGLALLENRNSPKTDHVNLSLENQVETNREYKCYNQNFKSYEHYDYTGKAENYGDFILSIKSDSNSHLTCILRTKDGNMIQNDISLKDLSVQNILNKFNRDMIVTEMKPVLHPTASDLIANYDKEIIKVKFTFGIIYQKFGQINEKEIFDNQSHSPEFDQFLDFIGERIKLKNFASFKGGLDVTCDDTGQESIYTQFQDSEIMFHVSTLLPHSVKDSQQIERKRHIGNDRVAIVFQDELTPFSPLMIKSKLLHVFIIIQPIKINDKIDGYQLSVLSRKDVPYFEPYILTPYVYKKDELFRNFLLTKLINAEYASLKAPAFSLFSEKTLSYQLSKLCDNLRDLTAKFCVYEVNRPSLTESPNPKSVPNLSEDQFPSNKFESLDKLKTIMNRVRNSKKSIIKRTEKSDSLPNENIINQMKYSNETYSANEITDDQESKQEETNTSDLDLSTNSTDLLKKKHTNISSTNLDVSQSKSLESFDEKLTMKKYKSKSSFAKRVEARFQKKISPGNSEE